MSFFIPVLGAILQASSFVLDKTVLSIRRVSFRTYTAISFPLIFFITFCIFLVIRPPLSADLFGDDLLLLIIISIALYILANLIYYRALDDDKLGELQTFELFATIPVIIVSSIIFSDERSVVIVILALAASCAVIWSHYERRHFIIKKNTLPFLFWVLMAAPASAIILKQLLIVWHPVSLELVRSGVTSLVLGRTFAREIRRVSGKALRLLVTTNILTTIAGLLLFFSYQRLGIVYTVLIFSLQPLLVYAASVVFLKERWQWKKSVAFGIVLVSAVIARIVQ